MATAAAIRRSAGSAGFTLIELVITVAIVGLLATAALPLLSMAMQREKERELRTALREIRAAIDDYREAADSGHILVPADRSHYPPSLDVLYQGVVDARSPVEARIYFLRRLPRDPFFPDATAAAADTWGQRSYASPPEAPLPGEDVFDVYALDAGKALNGIPYRDW
jgi:general secretion pathway protein G